MPTSELASTNDGTSTTATPPATAAAPSMARSSSYVLVSSTRPDMPAYAAAAVSAPPPRPRHYVWLPVLAAFDAATTLLLAALTPLPRQAPPSHRVPAASGGGAADPPAPFWDQRKTLLAIVVVGLLRSGTLAYVGVSRRIRRLGVAVAAVCILSMLYNISVANLLFQARGKPAVVMPPQTLPPANTNTTYSISTSVAAATMVLAQRRTVLSPSMLSPASVSPLHLISNMAFLVGSQMVFTLAEWLLYISVVGVKVPPGGNPVKARRWARSLARDPRYRDGVDAASLRLTDSEDDGMRNDFDEDDGDDEGIDFHDNHRNNKNINGAVYPTANEDGAEARTGEEAENATRSPTGAAVRSVSPNANAQRQATDETALLRATNERAALQSPRRGYGSTDPALTPPRQRKQSQGSGAAGSVRSHKAPSLTSRSRSVPFPSGLDAPRTAELGLVGRRTDDLEGYDDGELVGQGDDDDQDPNDIIDISSDRRLMRHASRRRLALAAHPERKISGGSNALSLGLGVGGGAGLLGRQRADGSSNSGAPRAWAAVRGTLPDGGFPRAASTSASQGGDGSSAAASPASEPKKSRKLPAWLTRSKTSPGNGHRQTEDLDRRGLVRGGTAHTPPVRHSATRQPGSNRLLAIPPLVESHFPLPRPDPFPLTVISTTIPITKLPNLASLTSIRALPQLLRAPPSSLPSSLAAFRAVSSLAAHTSNPTDVKLSPSSATRPYRISAASRLGQAANHLSSSACTFVTSASTKMPPVPKPTSQHYDMVVIGGGSGAMGVSRRTAYYGKKVCVIEEDGRLGGTCVNVGCVPKKLMWHAADIAEKLKEAPEYGFGDVVNKAEVPRFAWNYFAEKRDAYVRRLNGIYDRNLNKDGVEYISGHGKLVGKNEVEVTLRGEDGQMNAGTHRITGDAIVIATGGRPIVPSDDKIPGASLGINSDGFFALRKQPKRVVVVGAGYIAVELAGVLHTLGSETHLLIRRDKFLRTFDPIIHDTLAEYMDKTGLQVHRETNVTKVSGGNGKPLQIETDKGETIEADCLLWAIGRRPNTDNLGLEDVGVKTDAGGNIVVDKYQLTNIPNVYSIGDVQGKALLTPVAIAAGRKLSNRLYGHPDLRDDHMDYENIPTVIFSHPPSGTVGLSEEEAKKKFGEDQVTVHQTKFIAMYYGMLEHKAPSAYKLVVGPGEKIVGLHIVGLGVDEMLQGFAVAVKMGATARDFIETCNIHPVAGEELTSMIFDGKKP